MANPGTRVSHGTWVNRNCKTSPGRCEFEQRHFYFYCLYSRQCPAGSVRDKRTDPAAPGGSQAISELWLGTQ